MTRHNSAAAEIEELEDLNDLLLYKLAQIETANEELVPSAVVDRLMAGEPPVRVWREYRGLTVAALAAEASLPETEIAAIDDGREQGVSALAAVARALRVDLEDLVPWPQGSAGSP